MFHNPTPMPQSHTTLCSTLVPLYKAWREAIASLHYAKDVYQESGTTTDKESFETVLTLVHSTKDSYLIEAYKVVEYREKRIIAG